MLHADILLDFVNIPRMNASVTENTVISILYMGQCICGEIFHMFPTILSLLYLMSSIVADKVITQTLTQWDPKVEL